MGNCFSADEENSKTKLFQDFYYLYREKKYLLRVADGSISKYKFESSIKIRSDSAIGYLNDGRIITAGGTDSAGCLTNRAYIINPVSSEILEISHLPVASKEGAFFHYKTFVYYVGGVTEAEDEEIIAQEQTAPIMKYHLEEGSWEVFFEKRENKMPLQEYLQIQLDEPNSDDEPDVLLRDIMYPGMFMIGSKIYLINGQRMNAKGILKSMQSVFSIDLEEEDFCFQQEDFKSPLKVFRPVCGSYGEQGFITGGLKPSSKQCNMDTYLFSITGNKPVFTLVQGLKLALDDTYPVLSTNNTYFAISYPNVVIYDLSVTAWHQFTFGETPIQRSKVSYTTPVLDIKNFITDDIVKKVGIYSTKYKTFGKGESFDIKSGESLSEPENFPMKLPEGLILSNEYLESNSKDRFNMSNSSEDFSVDRKIEIPIARDSFKNKSGSSLNLSDRDMARLSNQKLAPIAKPGAKVKVDKKFVVDSSEESVQSYKKHKKNIPGMKIHEIDNEPEDISDRSSKRHKKSFESESSDFEINQVLPVPIQVKTSILVNDIKKHEDSDDFSPDPKEKDISVSVDSDEYEFRAEKPSNDTHSNIKEAKSNESSDFEFEQDVAKKPGKIVKKISDPHIGIPVEIDVKPEFPVEKHEKDLEKSRKLKMKQATFAGGLGKDKPKMTVDTKSKNIEDDEFGFESPTLNIKISEKGKSGRNLSPQKAAIHVKKISNYGDKEGHHIKGKDSGDSDVINKKQQVSKSKTVMKKKMQESSSSSESFEAENKVPMPMKKQEEIEESIDSSSNAHYDSKVEKKIDLSFENSKDYSIELEYELSKTMTINIVNSITAEFDIPNVSSSAFKTLFSSYGELKGVDCKTFEDIILKVIPKGRFRVTLLSNVLRKIHKPLGKGKIDNNRLLEIYNSAKITEDTTMVERDIICFCVSKAVGVVINS